jgi:hypothetical protein
MANPEIPDDENSAGVNTGPQSGTEGVGGEPEGARLEARDRPASTPSAGGPRRPEHSSGKAQPGYRARPAGRSGVGGQDERTSPIDGPQGDGNYIATDRGPKPLRGD